MSRSHHKLAAQMATEIPGLLRRDSEVVDRWYRRDHPEVYRLCLGFLADVHEAEDLAQDAMVKLLDNMDSFKRSDGKGYRSWRNAVVANLCRDRLRHQGVRRAADEQGRGPRPAALPDPQERARATEVREILVAALAQLPHREREVFVIRDLEGESAASCAESLGIGASTVRTLLSLARRRLRQHLGPGLTPGIRGGQHE